MLAKRDNQDRAKGCRRLAAVALAAFAGGCGDAVPTGPDVQAAYETVATSTASQNAKVHFAGEVQVVWNGGQGSGPSAGADRTVWASINAFPSVPEGNPGPGNFNFQVRSADAEGNVTVHREIGVKLTWAGLDEQTSDPSDIRWVGVVVSDTKPCGGSQHGAGGCGDGCSHDDGGGCTDDDGGCTHDDGGCTDDDGGCSHDDGTTHDGGGCSGGGEPGGGEPGGGGGHVSGSDCRIGQVVIGWAVDAATPALSGDRISWKWFAPDAPKVLEIQSAITHGTDIPWPCKLCEKEILGGNLVLNLRKQ